MMPNFTGLPGGLVVENPPLMLETWGKQSSIGPRRPPGEGHGHSTPAFLPGEAHGQRGLTAGTLSWGHMSRTATGRLSMQAPNT